MLVDDDGCIVIEARFTAITFKPFKGEILDCIVVKCDERSIDAKVGMAEVVISRSKIPQYWYF